MTHDNELTWRSQMRANKLSAQSDDDFSGAFVL